MICLAVYNATMALPIFQPANDDDTAYITRQLGRPISSVVGVAWRRSDGKPGVIANYPLTEDQTSNRLQPFPTLYWLICPQWQRRIAQWEMQGRMEQIEVMLAADAYLQHQVEADHRRYIAQRWALLSDADRQRIETAGLTDCLQSVGIAGMACFDSVKCLHAHFAQHLVDGNTIARLVEQT